MVDIKKLQAVEIHRPELKNVRKVVSVPNGVIYINRAAAPSANIIRLVQKLDELPFVLPRNH